MSAEKEQESLRACRIMAQARRAHKRRRDAFRTPSAAGGYTSEPEQGRHLLERNTAAAVGGPTKIYPSEVDIRRLCSKARFQSAPHSHRIPSIQASPHTTLRANASIDVLMGLIR